MKYTDSHEWIELEGSIGTVGITEYAKQELGDIVYIELPKIGQLIQKGEEACILESTKSAVDVYSPVSGKVVAVNESLRSNPIHLKGGSRSDGWLFRLEVSNPLEVEKLLSWDQYQGLCPS